ncbi:MAG: VOC family protein [Dehalococcoidia bacterium]|nr:VOC family protein [Dehalococcoidia bacterium]
MHAGARLVGFVPTRDPKAARRFYEDVLGLPLLSEDGFALLFDCGGGAQLRVVSAPPFEPQPFTIAGWQVDDITAEVAALGARGVAFVRFMADHDEAGVWTSPGGSKVAWFRDPDGNLLSLSQG